MIPQEKNAAVFRGQHQAFGTTTIEDIRKVTNGLSSDLVFRIVVQGSPYLLRIMTQINEMMDPGRIFACMSAAAEAGMAPGVRYSNAEDGISIADFVEDMPLSATDFNRRIWAGEVDLADNEQRVLYGMVHWQQLLQNMRQTRCDEALGIVSERNTSREGVHLLLPSAP